MICAGAPAQRFGRSRAGRQIKSRRPSDLGKNGSSQLPSSSRSTLVFLPRISRTHPPASRAARRGGGRALLLPASLQVAAPLLPSCSLLVLVAGIRGNPTTTSCFRARCSRLKMDVAKTTPVLAKSNYGCNKNHHRRRREVIALP